VSIPSRHSHPSAIQATLRTFFVTTHAAGRRNILQSDRMAGLLVDVLAHYRREGKFRLHEFVIMTNHIHLLLTVDGIPIEKAVQFVKGGFSFRAKKELGFLREVWQAGFSEVRILTVEDYEVRRRYIWSNPVKRGLVLEPSEFRWSSAYPGYALDGTPENLMGYSAFYCGRCSKD
jgi:putative transposase